MKKYLEMCSQNLLCALLSTYLFVAIIAVSIFVATKFVHLTNKPNLTSFYCDLKDNEMPNTQTRTMKLTDIEGQPLCIRVAKIDYIRMPKGFDQYHSKTGCIIHISGMALPVQEKFEDVEKQVRWAKGDD